MTVKRSDRAASSNPLSGLPVWARVIAWVGLPAAIGGYLVWMLAGAFTAKLDSIDHRLSDHESKASIVEKHLTDETEVSWALLGVLQRVCLNTSKTDEDRLACVAIAKVQK